MPLVLRGIRKKERWDKDKVYADYEWLKPNHIPPSCFIDLADPRNELSLWYIEDENDPNKEYICAAIAATKDSLKTFEYALFDVNAIEQAKIQLSPIDGDTPDNSIKHLHRDIENLTALMLWQFLQAVWDSAKTGLILKNDLREIILARVADDKIDPNRMDQKLRKDLGI